MLSALAPERLYRRPLITWLLFLLPGLVLYLPAWKAGMQQDFHGWLQMYHDLPFRDLLDRKGANAPSLYHLTQAQLYAWTWLFGTRQWLWFALFTALHAGSGLLLFRIARHICGDFGLPGAARIALAGTLLFLLHPAMSETVVWKACYHYHVAMICCLLLMGWSRQYLLSGRARFAWLVNGMLLLLTTTLELWYVFPWMGLCLTVVYRRSGLIAGDRFRAAILRLFVPQLLIFGGYLLAYHARYGMWLGRGAYADSGGGGFVRELGRIWTYEAQLWLGARLWPGSAHRGIHRFADSTAGWTTALLITCCVVLWLWLRAARKRSASGPLLIFMLWALLGLAIVLHFQPEELWVIANDRHLYFTAAFQCIGLFILLGRWLPARTPFRFVSAAVFLLAACITGYYAWIWRVSGKVFYGIQYNYRWDDAPAVLLLNVPANFRGAGIMHANNPDELGEHLRIFYRRKPGGSIVDVAEYNMQDIFNGAHVQVLDSMQLKVTLNQWGTWWMFHGLGLSGYENAYYRLEEDPSDALSYRLRLKQRPRGLVVLYSQGDQWREVDWSRKGEQW